MLNVIVWLCVFTYCYSKPIPGGRNNDIGKYSAINRNTMCNDCREKNQKLNTIQHNSNIDSTDALQDINNELDTHYEEASNIKRSLPFDQNDVLRCSPSDTHSTDICFPSINDPIQACSNMKLSNDAKPNSPATQSIESRSRGEKEAMAAFISLFNSADTPDNNTSTSDPPNNNTLAGTAKSECISQPLQSTLKASVNSPCIQAASTPSINPPVATCITPPIASPVTPPVASPVTPVSTPCTTTPAAVYTPSVTPYALPCSTTSNIAPIATYNTAAYQPARYTAPSVVPIATATQPCTTVSRAPCAATAPAYYIPYVAPSTPTCTTLSSPSVVPSITSYVQSGNSPCTVRPSTPSYVFHFNNASNICPCDSPPLNRPSNISVTSPCETHDFLPSHCNRSCNCDYEEGHEEPCDCEDHERHYVDSYDNTPYHDEPYHKANEYHETDSHFDDDDDSRGRPNKGKLNSMICNSGDMPDKMLMPYIVGCNVNKGSNSKIQMHEQDSFQHKSCENSDSDIPNKNYTCADDVDDRSYSENKNNQENAPCDSHQDCGEQPKGSSNSILKIFDGCSKEKDDESNPCEVSDNSPGTHDKKCNPPCAENSEHPDLHKILDEENSSNKPCTAKSCNPPCAGDSTSDKLNVHDFIDEENSNKYPCSESKICNPTEAAENSPSEKPTVDDLVDSDGSNKVPCDEDAICNPADAPSEIPCGTAVYHEHEHTHEHHHDDTSTTYVHEHHHHHHHHHEHDHIHHQCFPSCFCQPGSTASNACGVTRTPDDNSTQTSENPESSDNNSSNKSSVVVSSIDQLCNFLINNTDKSKVVADKKSCICCYSDKTKNKKDCICKLVECHKCKNCHAKTKREHYIGCCNHPCNSQHYCHHHCHHNHHHHHQHNCCHHHRHRYHHHHHHCAHHHHHHIHHCTPPHRC